MDGDACARKCGQPKRMIQISRLSSDAPEFLARVGVILDRIAATHPLQIYVIRIDNWFGKKWIGFAGKALGAMGIGYQEDLVLPPFVPNRVIDQACYEYSPEAGTYRNQGRGTDVHVRQPSRDNFRRKLSTFFPGAALLWFSGNSGPNGRGSILAYVPTSAGHEPWFAEFRSDRRWRVTEVIGLTAAECGGE
jgi:hypothetical protein